MRIELLFLSVPTPVGLDVSPVRFFFVLSALAAVVAAIPEISVDSAIGQSKARRVQQDGVSYAWVAGYTLSSTKDVW